MTNQFKCGTGAEHDRWVLVSGVEPSPDMINSKKRHKWRSSFDTCPGVRCFSPQSVWTESYLESAEAQSIWPNRSGGIELKWDLVGTSAMCLRVLEMHPTQQIICVLTQSGSSWSNLTLERDFFYICLYLFPSVCKNGCCICVFDHFHK